MLHWQWNPTRQPARRPSWATVTTSIAGSTDLLSDENGSAMAAHSTMARARTGNVPIPDDGGRDGEEPERPAAEPVEAAQVLDDRDAGPQQHRVDRPLARAGVVDVDRVDADDGGAGVDEALGRVDAEERVVGVAVAVGPPVGVPAGPEQHGPPGDVHAVEQVGRRRSWAPDASTTTPATSATRAGSRPARSWPSANRWNGVSR